MFITAKLDLKYKGGKLFMKKVLIVTNTYFYKTINHENWYVDIAEKSDCYELWLYKETSSHKRFVAGLPKNSGVSLAGVEFYAKDILADKTYINIYNEEVVAIEAYNYDVIKSTHQ